MLAKRLHVADLEPGRFQCVDRGRQGVQLAVGEDVAVDERGLRPFGVTWGSPGGIHQSADLTAADDGTGEHRLPWTLGEPFTAADTTAEQVIVDAALASREEDDDPIDVAVLGGLGDDSALQGYQVVGFQPFDPVHKRTEATVRGPDGTTFKVSKGAPQVILALSADGGHAAPAAAQAVTDFAARGFRSLGVARAAENGRWQLVGVLPLSDPPREDAKSTIATARQMGVSVKMVTGDALAIAKETATRVGLGADLLDAGCGLGRTGR